MRSIWRYLGSNRGPLLAGAIAGVALLAVVFGGEAALSTDAFCTGCHSMSYPAAELRKSTHYGVVGADPGCKDCHIPQGLANFPRAVAAHLVDGTRELVLHFRRDYSDIGKFNANRLAMAHYARMRLKEWDSVTCRACHREPRPPGKTARADHEKMKHGRATCIDCHQNLVHKEVEETDLDKSLAQGRMVLKDE